MTDPAVSIADTSRLTAMFRARESERADPLFHDPWARRLAGERGHEIERRNWRIPAWPMITRTRLVDDHLLAAIADGADRVVNLAAGLDMRPYRLALDRELTWFEADLPDLVAVKEQLIAGAAPRCRVVRRGVDLRDATARAAFLDEALGSSTRAVVITEGFIVYLPDADVRDVARELHARSQVAWWITDVASPRVLRMLDRQTRRTFDDEARFQFAPADGVRFFEPLGFRAEASSSLFHEAARLRRLPMFLRLFARGQVPDAGSREWSGVVRLARRELGGRS
jgi:methyltransferase (TIGR00027 family)